MEEFLFELGNVVLQVELSKRGSPRLLRQLGEIEEERVVLQKIGKYWNQINKWDRPDGLIVVTTHRFVFLAKVTTITTKTDFFSVPFDLIEKWEETRVWGITPAVRFTVEGKPYVFTVMKNAAEITRVVEPRLKKQL